jgi:transketolase
MAEITKQQDTRRIFVETLNELAEHDPNIVVIIPDVGFNYLDDPKNKFKVLNLGVTEQSTMIIAAGMALSGLKPYVYSMINFVTFRPYEAVRNAVCLHNANVKIIGVKGSEKYKFLGFSHNLIIENEEMKALENLPDFKCFIAEDIEEVRRVILETYKTNLPCYIRI